MISYKLYAAVVLYNTEFRQSTTAKLLRSSFKDIHLVVIDNSTDADVQAINRMQTAKKQVTYLGMDGNAGLSKAYNAGVRFISNDAKALSANKVWMMVLDQDTHVSEEYIMAIYDAISGKHGSRGKAAAVLTGEVYFNGYIGSPMRVHPLRPIIKTNDYWENAECINSCMVLRFDALLSVGGYDERIFLDQVDRMILWRFRKAGYTKLCVVGGKIDQAFSGDTFGTKRADMARFKLYKKDTIEYIKITRDRIMTLSFSILKRWLHIQIHYIVKSLTGKGK